MRWLDECNARGHTGLRARALTSENNFQFTFEEWNLFDTSPVWREMTLGTVPERAAKLADPERRGRRQGRVRRLRAHRPGRRLLHGRPHHRRGAQAGARKVTTGLTVAEAAEERGQHVIDAMLDIAPRGRHEGALRHLPASVTTWTPCGRWRTSAFALPGVSDGGAHTKFITLGRYPTEFLALLVR